MVIGAEGGTRTPTVLLPPAPQAGASANSATSAGEGPERSVVRAVSFRAVRYRGAPERVRDVPALALLQEHHEHQHEAHQDIECGRYVIQHRSSDPAKLQLYRRLAAPRNDVEKAPDIEARAADQRAVHVGLRDQ